MTRRHQIAHALAKLRLGLRGCCPECERGEIMDTHFRVNEKCAYCGVRFERGSGDAIGGVYINVAIAEFTALSGFFLVNALTDIAPTVQLAFWIPYVLLFSAFFYPYARGLWVAVVYLTGGIHADFDYERGEYIAGYTRPVDRTPREREDT